MKFENSDANSIIHAIISATKLGDKIGMRCNGNSYSASNKWHSKIGLKILYSHINFLGLEKSSLLASEAVGSDP